jgi:hypothetical protein
MVENGVLECVVESGIVCGFGEGIRFTSGWYSLTHLSQIRSLRRAVVPCPVKQFMQKFIDLQAIQCNLGSLSTHWVEQP